MPQPVDADEAFSHLQELLDELPHMQELGERARLAHAASALAAPMHALDAARATLARCEDELGEARRAFDAACGAGEGARAEHLRREVMFLADQLALAKGPVNDAAFHLAKQLEREGATVAAHAAHGEVAPAQELAAAAAGFVAEHGMPADELAALDARIASYQQEYQHAYDVCRELDDDARD